MSLITIIAVILFIALLSHYPEQVFIACGALFVLCFVFFLFIGYRETEYYNAHPPVHSLN